MRGYDSCLHGGLQCLFREFYSHDYITSTKTFAQHFDLNQPPSTTEQKRSTNPTNSYKKHEAVKTEKTLLTNGAPALHTEESAEVSVDDPRILHVKSGSGSSLRWRASAQPQRRAGRSGGCPPGTPSACNQGNRDTKKVVRHESLKRSNATK